VDEEVFVLLKESEIIPKAFDRLIKKSTSFTTDAFKYE
jgi:hypothetical protein